MENFNVLPPSRQLRTSDYIPEIIQFIQKLVTNGFGHELNSSIYFDTSNFQEQHLYPKLGYDQTGDVAGSIKQKESINNITRHKQTKNESI